MSQAKVDKYKEYKKNRRQNIAKEKRKELIGRVAAWSVIGVFALFIVAAVIYKQVDNYQARLAAMPDYQASSYVLPDLASVLTEETETEAAE